MELFTIAKEKCTRCARCALVCPVDCIEMREPERWPLPRRGAVRSCIDCGHCVAVCPHQALTHRVEHLEDCQPLPKEWALTPAQVEAFLKGRRSIRLFRDQPVPRETLERVLDIARYAPSGTNAQPVRWVVLHQSGSVRKVSEAVIAWLRSLPRQGTPASLRLYARRLLADWESGKDPICRFAPHLIACKAPADSPVASQDSVIALTYLELAAVPFGLGTCWAGFVHIAASRSPEVRAALGIPEGQACNGAVMIGHPRVAYKRIPARKKLRATWR